MKKLNGKVARILNDREVVLSRGTRQGLTEGEYVGIFDPLTEGIKDPETGENLGGVRRFKVTLRVTQVSERLAIASTYKTTTVNVGGSFSAGADVARLMSPPKYVTKVEKLTFDDESARPITFADSRVGVGDDFELISKETADSGIKLEED